jgi:hypothetical protein
LYPDRGDDGRTRTTGGGGGGPIWIPMETWPKTNAGEKKQ